MRISLILMMSFAVFGCVDTNQETLICPRYPNPEREFFQPTFQGTAIGIDTIDQGFIVYDSIYYDSSVVYRRHFLGSEFHEYDSLGYLIREFEMEDYHLHNLYEYQFNSDTISIKVFNVEGYDLHLDSSKIDRNDYYLEKLIVKEGRIAEHLRPHERLQFTYDEFDRLIKTTHHTHSGKAVSFFYDYHNDSTFSKILSFPDGTIDRTDLFVNGILTKIDSYCRKYPYQVKSKLNADNDRFHE